MERVVARIGRAHGLRGEVSAEVRTDTPGMRFVPGAVFTTPSGTLTVEAARDHSGVLLLRFEGVSTREGAEALRGTELVVDVTTSDEPDAWYDHELVGLRAVHVDGHDLGEVVRLDAGAAQDLLVVRPAGGGESQGWPPTARNRRARPPGPPGRDVRRRRRGRRARPGLRGQPCGSTSSRSSPTTWPRSASR